MPKANKLIHETSPYLLQHAYNPVNWQAWNSEALTEAERTDKPILLSIGYAACHWCHVMEHECFEDNEVARVMNENFICIKLDREERPDIDQIYMDAIQNMGLNGGWPLNVFLMPNQKPFYGGTYFPKKNWLSLLDNVALAFQKDRAKLSESADNFALAINSSEAEKLNFGQSKDADFHKNILDATYQQFEKFMDWDLGGTVGAPKFPMPVIWQFLTRFAALSGNKKASEAVEFTLTSIGQGGIYDQIGGGFARYSVDAEWFAPHFEKMLYDNGQLISLYANQYRLTKNNYFKTIIEESIQFLERELLNSTGGFYAALDADSEGEEGKFYVWTFEEWKKTLGKDHSLMAKFFNITAQGNWENGVNIPYQHTAKSLFCIAEKVDEAQFDEKLQRSKNKLLKERNKRVRPGLDDKTLCGWNALMLKGLCDAYKAINKSSFLQLATQNYQFLLQNMLKGNKLFRSFKNGKASIDAYLEDYALCIQAFITYSEISGDLNALDQAVALTNYTITNFYDEKEQLFFYTDEQAEKLIARKKEIFDNVIPSSNSIMVENLHWLSILTGQSKFMELSDAMLKQVQHLIPKEPKYLSNWASAYSLKAYISYDVVILGPDAKNLQQLLWRHFLPNVIVLALETHHSELTVLKGKEMLEGKTTIYVCQNNACQKPVHTIEDALEQLKK
jgi:hypothetical protein